MPDFRVQNNFPMSDVINAAQRKGQLENDTTFKQSEMFNQSLNAIGAIGQSLLDRRKRMAQAMLLSQQPEVADMLSGGDRTVAQGPNGSVRSDQTAQGGVGIEPKQNAAPLNPQNAALLLEGQDPLAVLKQAFARKQAMAPVKNMIAIKDIAGNIVGYEQVDTSKGGKVVLSGPAPAGATDKDQRIRQMAAARVKEKVTTDINEIARGKQQIDSLFTKYNNLVEMGLAGDPIRGNIAKGIAKGSGGHFGTEDVKAFLDVRDGLIASLRKVTGDVGVLTETDAKRLIGLLSDLSEDPKAAGAKMTQVNEIFSSAAKRASLKGNTLIKEIQSGLDIAEIDSQSIFDQANPGAALPPPTSDPGVTRAPPPTAPAQALSPDLAHLSTKELMELRAKMTAHKEQKKS